MRTLIAIILATAATSVGAAANEPNVQEQSDKGYQNAELGHGCDGPLARRI
jgi:hypothetical protein